MKISIANVYYLRGLSFQILKCNKKEIFKRTKKCTRTKKKKLFAQEYTCN